MSKLLQGYIHQSVTIITTDGRVMVGKLRGMDQTVNLVVEECVEYVYSAHQPMTTHDLGTQILRGDTIVLVGNMDEVGDLPTSTHAMPFKPIVH